MRLSHVHAIVRWLEDFEKVKVLGVGGTGIVYELLHKSNGQRYAMKEMEIKNKSQMQMAISEAEMLKDIMENVSHPNIMHIEKVFQVGSKFYLVFPLCTGGELYEHIIRKGKGLMFCFSVAWYLSSAGFPFPFLSFLVLLCYCAHLLACLLSLLLLLLSLMVFSC
jgi:serine/threonine protein kinase